HARKELDEIGIPYQILNQGDAQSLRITEGSGISFIYTLEKK
ncbi:VOC family protein, partial [Brevibacillus laterosporus]|nr:VOC family protein [Brevibacillus laterosporus]